MARGRFDPSIYVKLPGDELLQPSEEEVKAAKAEAGQMRRQERIYTPQELEAFRLHRISEEEQYARYAAPLPGNGHNLMPLVRGVSLKSDSIAAVAVRWVGEIQRDGKVYRVTSALQQYELPISEVKDADDDG